MDRIALLTEVLAQNPTDAFARYGLAMEYSNSGEVERALEEFGRLLATHPDYTAGYFMAAQTLAKPSAPKKLGRCWWTESPVRGKPGMATPSRKWKACSPNWNSD
jgi:tetratricopeptide (TPR) repeat protein